MPDDFIKAHTLILDHDLLVRMETEEDVDQKIRDLVGRVCFTTDDIPVRYMKEILNCAFSGPCKSKAYLPTEMVVSKPGFVIPNEVQYYYVGYNTYLVEYWQDTGDDGHTDYQLEGWFYIRDTTTDSRAITVLFKMLDYFTGNY